jgi:hypothetical protein
MVNWLMAYNQPLIITSAIMQPGKKELFFILSTESAALVLNL